jgi:adenosylcobinamide-phosphate synthase
MADVIGRPSRRHGAFGFTASRLGDVLTLPAAIIAGPIMALAAIFVPRTRPVRALAGWARDLAERGMRTSFRAEGAMAGALDIALGGPRPFDGETLPGSWIGEGRARATVADIRRAVLLITVACLLVALLIALALVVPAR